MPVSDEAIALHKESVVIDIHCHPTLKIKLFDYDINDIDHKFLNNKIKNSPNDSISQMQYDLPQMEEGGVNAIWSSIYVVEKDFVNKSNLQIPNSILKFVGCNFSNIVENTFLGGPFLQALKLMDKLEKQIKDSDYRTIKSASPKNYVQLKEALESGKKCFVHSAEGTHMLGRDLKSADVYLQNLETLFNRGVCSMTLSHFMPNDICYPVNGVSPETKKMMGLNFDYKKYENEGLTETGKAVVERMLELGMIVDLNHLTPKGRDDVFEINNRRNGRKRPLCFTHTGIRLNCPGEKLTPTIEEIKKIRDCRGVIGVIFMKYWLIQDEGKPDPGIEFVIKTIQDIAVICDGKYDNIAIGSDMDGFTEPMDDLFCSKQMPRLTQAMLDANIKPDDIKKVLGLNAMRVLEEGWR